MHGDFYETVFAVLSVILHVFVSPLSPAYKAFQEHLKSGHDILTGDGMPGMGCII